MEARRGQRSPKEEVTGATEPLNWVQRARGGPKPGRFVTERPWLRSRDTGSFLFGKKRKYSVGLHSRAPRWASEPDPESRVVLLFGLAPQRRIGFIRRCHVQSNHMPGLKSTINIQITKDARGSRGMITHGNRKTLCMKRWERKRDPSRLEIQLENVLFLYS